MSRAEPWSRKDKILAVVAVAFIVLGAILHFVA